MKKKLAIIIGARPQFIKHFAFEKAAQEKFDLITIHTGQHYDENMSKVFFDQLGMQKPDYKLNLGGGNHGTQTGRMLIELEQIILSERPQAIVVYGDTNSTLAGALVASKLHISVIHIEAGLRSYNKEMPEEINRLLCDHVSEVLFVPSAEAKTNLAKEGIVDGVFEVGDIMKDVLKFYEITNPTSDSPFDSEYYYATLHRPYNVDNKQRLIYLLDTLSSLKSKVVFSIHPRTMNRMQVFNIEFELNYSHNIHLINPQPYFQNLNWLKHSKGLITDSGGMQKEAYWLSKNCATIRKETEWIDTLHSGSNVLFFEDLSSIETSLNKYCDFDSGLYGDGETAQKIVFHLEQKFNN